MMKTLLKLALSVLALSLCNSANAMPHDPAACNSATVINCGTNFNNHTNLNSSNRLEEYTCTGEDGRIGYDGKERIYQINVNFKQHYDIRLNDVSDPELNFDLFLMAEDCAIGDCILSSTNDDNTPERISAELNPGTYYLIVDTWAGETGTYDLSVECGPVPAIGNCRDATSIWCDELMSGNTWGKSNDFDADLYNCYGGTGTYNGGDVIYSFTKRRASDHIQLHLFTDAGNLNIFLVSRCDESGFSCVASGKDFNGGKFIDEEDLGLPAGEYYVIVDGRNSATDGAYSILLSCDEYDFSGADELICGKPLENQNFTGSINQKALYACRGANQTLYNGGERVFYFDLATVTNIQLKLDKTSTFGDLGLFLFEQGTNRPICLDSGERIGGDEIITASLDRGRYYVIVDNKKEGFFTLSLTGCICPVDGSLECDEPITASNAGGGDDVLYTGGECQRTPLRLDAQDRVYEFTAQESRTYEFKLYNLEKDLGLFLFEDCNDPETCVGFSNKNGDDSISIYLEEGETVYAVVDGTSRLVTSSFNLEVVCNPRQDRDGDGVEDQDDNCPDTANADQADLDNDGMGDVCDDDDDNDGVPDGLDCNPMNANIDYSIGDSCDDGDPATINDEINEECNCSGSDKPDADGDGIPDDEDNCPFMVNDDQVDSDMDGEGNACDDDDDNDGVPDDIDCSPLDAQVTTAIGDACDDGDENTVNDRINKGCVCEGDEAPGPLQLMVESSSGGLGDTICFDILVTEFTDVSSASFSVTLDNGLAKILSITNASLPSGTFTGSGCVTTRTGSGTGGFVVWTADGGSGVTLGPITPLVEVCAEIVSDEFDCVNVSITDEIRDVEFFDSNADPIAYTSNSGQICLEDDDPTLPGMSVSGQVMNIASVALTDVNVAFSGNTEKNTLSDIEGSYQFTAEEGESFDLTPSSTNEIMEHVSVFDVVLFRQHFIFNKSFFSPYQYIAADIDGNGRLSIRDEQLMKLMVLGLDYGDYPLWRFVKADHEWPDMPEYATGGPVFDYPSYASISELSDDMSQDFIGIRVGDLQLSDLIAENRSTTRTGLSTDDVDFLGRESLTVPFSINRGFDMAGFSMELDFDQTLLEFENFTSSLPGDLNEMISTRFTQEGKLIIQWVGDKSLVVAEDMHLFDLTFKTKGQGRLSQTLSLSNVYRPSEVVSESLELSDLTLEFLSNSGSEQLIIYPNPTTDVANINYRSSTEGAAVISFFNINGQRVASKNVTLYKGENTIEIARNQLGIPDGLVFLELNTGEDVIRKSMIFIQ